MGRAALPAALGLDDPHGIVARLWSETEEDAAPDSPVGVPSAAALAEWAEAVGLTRRTREAVVAHLKTRLRDPSWARFYRICRAHLHRHDGKVGELPVVDAPEADRMLDRLILALCGVPELRRRHAALGVPPAVTAATAADLSRWTAYFEAELGAGGINERILGWYQNHTAGRLLEIGRLQYIPATFDGGVEVYRRADGGSVRVFREDGVRFDQEGLAPEAGTPCPSCRTARFEADDHLITGNLVRADGRISAEPISIAASEWRSILGDGSAVIEVHIPAGSPLSLSDCAESMDEAAALLPAWFDGLDFVAFVCDAWFLDPRLDDLLSPSSNILRFARRFYRYSIEAEPSEAVARVFGERARDRGIQDAPRDTELRRSFAAHLESGGVVTAAGGFYLREDLPFRDGVYK